MEQEKLMAVLTAHSLWRSSAGVSGSRANLSRADLSGANLSRANLSGADLSGTNLSGANLSRANLYGVNLSGADLSGANLYGTNLSGANLSGADLYGANLSRADLYGANLSGADLSGADLSGANMYVSYFWRYLVNANSEQMSIGCETHTWAEWKEKGVAIARQHHGADCAKQFKEMWPVLDAARKMLQKRFKA